MQFTRPLVLALGLTLSTAATGLTIDNFEEGDFTVQDVIDVIGDDVTSIEQTGLSPANVVGGVRLVTVRAFGETAPIAIASLTTTPGEDSVLLTATETGRFTFIYDGIAGGSSNQTTSGALGLNLNPYVNLSLGLAGGTGTYRVAMWDGSGIGITDPIPILPGTNLIPLGTFTTLNLGDIRAIRVVLDGVSGAAAITDFSAVVPEPGSGLLLGLGIGLLAARRRMA